MTFYSIKPVPAPRQVRRDLYNPSPSVLRYRAFQDECRLRGVEVPESCELVFYMPFPLGYSDKKRLELEGKPHQFKPDLDNLIKALLDSVLKSDERVWNISAMKVWSKRCGIEVCSQN
jgi:Holliday junction resolvase RusA-like endonuclease